MLVLFAIAGWAIWESWTLYKGYDVDFKGFYIASGLLLTIQIILSLLDKPRKGTFTKDDIHSIVLIPVYNENSDSLRSCLESLLNQTHVPDEVHVVDDGSNAENYTKLKKWFTKEGASHNIIVSWKKQKTNMGKREAHATGLDGVDRNPNTIIITVDSDATLDPRAIEEGVKPFADPLVQSVAGLVLAKNAQANILSRFTDLLFVGVQQLVDRASMSRLGSVLVNSGGLAFYRAPIVDAALKHGYTNETFFGRPVGFSDDSYLTLFALLNGKTVQQSSAIVFADMPINFDHHFRQQMRWLRGSFIRSWWRLRYLPVLSWGFARQALGWLMLAANTTIIAELLVVMPLTDSAPIPYTLLVVPFILGYIQAVRYFSVVRSDMSIASQFGIFLLAPLAMVWSLIVLRSMRWYAMATCFKTGWGTRSVVEIQTQAISSDI